jgi:hypothetical protein
MVPRSARDVSRLVFTNTVPHNFQVARIIKTVRKADVFTRRGFRAP